MQKDMASLILGLVALLFTFLAGQNAILSIPCALIGIVFGILSLKEKGKILFSVIGIITSFIAIILLTITYLI